MQHILKDVYTIMPKLILLVMCFDSHFMFDTFKWKMQPHVKYLCFQTFPTI
jgi:hypothetical protein